MGIDAVALLRIRATELTKSFERHADGPELLRGRNGEPFSVTTLDDATLVSTSAGFDSEPDELSLQLRRLLGDVLDQHQDERGIYVFPDVAKPRERAYEPIVEELGELGFWLQPLAADDAPDRLAETVPETFEAKVRDMVAGIDGDTLREAERALASGDPARLREVSQRVEAGLGDQNGQADGLQKSLNEALDQVKQQLGPSPGGAAGGMPDLGALLPSALSSGGDLLALANAARQQLEGLSAEERAQVAALARQFGLPIGDPADLMAALGGLASLGGSTPEETAAGSPPAGEATDRAADEERDTDEPGSRSSSGDD